MDKEELANWLREARSLVYRDKQALNDNYVTLCYKIFDYLFRALDKI